MSEPEVRGFHQAIGHRPLLPPSGYGSLNRNNRSPGGMILRAIASSSANTSSLSLGLQKRMIGLLSATGRVSGGEDGLVAARKSQGEGDLPAKGVTHLGADVSVTWGWFAEGKQSSGHLALQHEPLLSTFTPSEAYVRTSRNEKLDNLEG